MLSQVFSVSPPEELLLELELLELELLELELLLPLLLPPEPPPPQAQSVSRDAARVRLARFLSFITVISHLLS